MIFPTFTHFFFLGGCFEMALPFDVHFRVKLKRQFSLDFFLLLLRGGGWTER